MKLEVGMYVRTKNGMKIGKIVKIHKAVNHKSWYELKNGLRIYSYEEIIEPSYNKIDLIEVGDYVNGSKLISIDYAEDNEGNCDKLHYYYQFEDDDKDINEYYEKLIIKSIVTKEQFESMEYKL